MFNIRYRFYSNRFKRKQLLFSMNYGHYLKTTTTIADNKFLFCCLPILCMRAIVWAQTNKKITPNRDLFIIFHAYTFEWAYVCRQYTYLHIKIGNDWKEDERRRKKNNGERSSSQHTRMWLSQKHMEKGIGSSLHLLFVVIGCVFIFSFSFCIDVDSIHTN